MKIASFEPSPPLFLKLQNRSNSSISSIKWYGSLKSLRDTGHAGRLRDLRRWRRYLWQGSDEGCLLRLDFILGVLRGRKLDKKNAYDVSDPANKHVVEGWSIPLTRTRRRPLMIQTESKASLKNKGCRPTGNIKKKLPTVC